MLTVLASAIGPLLLAETLRHTGSYDLIFDGLAVAVALLGVASWRVALPSRPLAAPPPSLFRVAHEASS
jgi:hypothetical protein